jgi:flagellar biosynthetic protein FliR
MNIGWLTTVILLSVRIAAATAMAAALGPSDIPGSVRVALAVVLAGVITLAAGLHPIPLESVGQLLVASAGEAVIGAALAGGFLIAYAATQVAGRILDTQSGFGVAGIFDPATGSVAPLFGMLLGMTGICFFLAMDGHLVLIRAIAQSAETFPPGAALTDIDWPAALAQGSAMFVYGLALAAPVMVALLLADVAMAVCARSLPQLNVFLLGFPLKVMIGLAGLAIAVRFAGSVLRALFESTFRYWAHIATGV